MTALSMIALRDRDIRPALKERLLRQSPKAIIDELRIDDGRAIADVVALFSEAHCYEIKGSTDKVERLKTQGPYFCQSFRKITLVTTENHIERAVGIVPEYWGLLVASSPDKVEEVGRLRLKCVRKAQINPNFCKTTALLTLWKKELVTMIEGEDPSAHRRNRTFLAREISSKISKNLLSKNITELLINRASGAA